MKLVKESNEIFVRILTLVIFESLYKDLTLIMYQKLKKDQGNAKSAIGANRERQDWKFWFDDPEENYFKMQATVFSTCDGS